jgi:hypothetical protein
MKHHRIGLSKWRRALGAVIAATVLVLPAVAREGSSVRVGEVTAKSGAVRLDGFRRVLVEELGALQIGETRESGGFVLSASVVKLDARSARDEAVASCTVSATLRTARGGTMVAMLRGSGRVVEAASALETAKQDALRVATRSAVRRVPEAVGRSR